MSADSQTIIFQHKAGEGSLAVTTSLVSGRTISRRFETVVSGASGRTTLSLQTENLKDAVTAHQTGVVVEITCRGDLNRAESNLRSANFS